MTTLALMLAETKPYGKNSTDYFIIVVVVIIAYLCLRSWWKKR
jgi:hypothetical protein